jgi:uncharacterized protein (TIGR03437 family)
MKCVLALPLVCLPAGAIITSLECQASVEPAFIRSEGLAERLGTVTLVCSGLEGGFVASNMTLTVSAPVANRISRETVDVVLTADTNLGRRVIGGSPRALGNSLQFEPFFFFLPDDGRTVFQISNIRITPNPADDRPISVSFVTAGSSAFRIRSNPVVAASPRLGLLASTATLSIAVSASPLPDSINFRTLLAAKTKTVTFRVTESAAAVFERRKPDASNGIRILIRYAGLPRGTRVFVPEVIVGLNATEATSAGDLGVPASPGRYAPGASGSLLLVRVREVDESGAGGSLPLGASQLRGQDLTPSDVSEVTLRNGSGWAAFEVLDTDLSAMESALIPTFIAAPAPAGEGTTATARISLAPLSEALGSSSEGPVPRFRDLPPGSDCVLVGGCDATPRLVVDAQGLQFNPTTLSRVIRLTNAGTGTLRWSSRVMYRNGSGWLRVTPESGTGDAVVTVASVPDLLPPGNYEAVLIIDAGSAAGSRMLPITLTLAAAPAGDPPRFWTVGNAADLGVAALAPGSLATLQGTRLRGGSTTVTFDGVAGRIVALAEGEITVVVPERLGARVQLVVTVDGISSAAVSVAIAHSAPAIFARGILNADGSVNSERNPQQAGGALQVFATGLALSGEVSVRIHDREIVAPLFAGPAPGLPGVQQVNFTVPADLPSLAAEVIVCSAGDAGAARTCSPPRGVTIRRP